MDILSSSATVIRRASSRAIFVSRTWKMSVATMPVRATAATTADAAPKPGRPQRAEGPSDMHKPQRAAPLNPAIRKMRLIVRRRIRRYAPANGRQAGEGGGLFPERREQGAGSPDR